MHPVINEVDEALSSLLRQEALLNSDVEVVLDAPTRDWASRRTAPTVNMYLYDLREDSSRRMNGRIRIPDADGKVTGYRKPPRTFRLAYLVTAWTQRPEDEHRLLTALLGCFIRHEVIPPEMLPGALRRQGYPIGLQVAQPPPDNRKVPDVWSSLGGDLKPSLDVVATMPVDLDLMIEAARAVDRPLRIRPTGYNTMPDLDEAARDGRMPVAAATEPDPGEASEGSRPREEEVAL